MTYEERGHPCPHEREARHNIGSAEKKLSVLRTLCGQGCPRSGLATISMQCRQNLQRLTYLFIGVEKMRRHAQTYSRTTIDKDFSFRESLDHRRAVFNVDHDRSTALIYI